MRYCPKCKKDQPEEKWCKGKLVWCNDCIEANFAEFAMKRPITKRDEMRKPAEALKALSYRHEQKVKAVEYKGGKCQACGYNQCLASLDFHHRNPLLKHFLIGKAISDGYAFEDLVPELDLCDLLCKNCHTELHSEKLKNFHRKMSAFASADVRD